MDLKVFGKILYLPTWANFSAIGQISLLQMTNFETNLVKQLF